MTVFWFRPDDRKDGGAYLTTEGRLKKIDVFGQLLLLTDGTAIPMEDIRRIDSELLFQPDDLA